MWENLKPSKGSFTVAAAKKPPEFPIERKKRERERGLTIYRTTFFPDLVVIVETQWSGIFPSQ